MFDDMDYPKPHDVAHMAFGAVLASMAPTGGSATGSAKSGPGEWASIDVAKDKAYHIMRAFRHGTTYWNLRHGTETDPNGETDEEHLMKMITRAAMELAILRAEKAQKGT
jgi:hypothetical protein